MKQGKVTGMVFAGINIILTIVCVILYFKADRIAPHFEFQAVSTVFREGMSQEELSVGVLAYDNIDGDVTDRIVIEKMIEDTQSESVVVFYAVSDMAGNVAKTSRVFETVFEEQRADRYMEAGIEAALEMESVTIDQRAEEEQGAEEKEGIQEEAEPSPISSAEPSPLPTPVLTPQPEQQSILLQEAEPKIDPAVPVLTLKMSEVRIKAGQGPAWVDVIGTLTDDKDNYETLFRNLHVSKYDRDKAGYYNVTVYTEDSDGNRSESVPLTIIVE